MRGTWWRWLGLEETQLRVSLTRLQRARLKDPLRPRPAFRCPVCGKAPAAAVPICPHCLSELWTNCPHCGEIVLSGRPLCPVCRRKPAGRKARAGS